MSVSVAKMCFQYLDPYSTLRFNYDLVAIVNGFKCLKYISVRISYKNKITGFAST